MRDIFVVNATKSPQAKLQLYKPVIAEAGCFCSPSLIHCHHQVLWDHALPGVTWSVFTLLNQMQRNGVIWVPVGDAKRRTPFLLAALDTGRDTAAGKVQMLCVLRTEL